MSDLLAVAVVLAVLCMIGAAISLAEANDRVNAALAHVRRPHPAGAPTPGDPTTTA
ncbi:hypothetical protein AB0M36_32125 [Actinoplanes sp. NPDC051346]|uniref:hypothetical protein n=1 Tax=Actinoplanes sp. NPDC051346 TaxID=3155048 RepID=UPI00344072E0